MNKTVAVRQLGAPAQMEGILNTAMYPGTIVQIDDVVNETFQPTPQIRTCAPNEYLDQAVATGQYVNLAPGQFLALMEDELQGGGINDQIAANTQAQVRRFLTNDIMDCILEDGVPSVNVGNSLYLSADGSGHVTTIQPSGQPSVAIGRAVSAVSSVATGAPVSDRRIKVLITIIN